MDEIEAVCAFLKYLPLEDEILDFFRPVASKIVQLMRARPCLPSEAPPGGKCAWLMPFKLLLSSDPLVREVIPAAQLQQLLNMSYLHRDVTQRISHSLLTSLGVQTMTSTHLLEFARMTLIKDENVSPTSG